MYSIRSYFYSLMTDSGKAPVHAPIKFVLHICSLIYGIAVRALSAGYVKRFFVAYKADPKVISIGNITLGGTGKTQAVMSVARALEGLGKRVSVLIRGYGTDEYRMLQEELKEVPILVGPDRIRNSQRAFYDFGADTIILDDGFQHFKIYRDLDIVLVDASNPFGNGRLIPRGILREPLSALKRAGLIIITKKDSDSAALDEIYSVIERLGKGDSVAEAVYKPRGLYDINRAQDMGLEAIRDKKICLVAGIGNPGYFRKKLIGLGAHIEAEYIFLDHYNYQRDSFLKIARECEFFGAEFIVVTKKDAVKIKNLALSGDLRVPVLALDVEFAITKNKKLLNDRLSGLYSN